jgi:hypothetical protein
MKMGVGEGEEKEGEVGMREGDETRVGGNASLFVLRVSRIKWFSLLISP